MQIVKVECQACEGVEEYEFDGCLILGWVPGKGLYFKKHEFSLAEAVRQAPKEWLDDCIDALIEGLKGQ